MLIQAKINQQIETAVTPEMDNVQTRNSLNRQRQHQRLAILNLKCLKLQK